MIFYLYAIIALSGVRPMSSYVALIGYRRVCTTQLSIVSEIIIGNFIVELYNTENRAKGINFGE